MSIFVKLDENLLEDQARNTDDDRWRITDMDAAAWASRKAQSAMAAIEDINAWEAREVGRVQEVARRERARIERDVVFFKGHLAEYLTRLIADGRAKKSLELPGGKVALRARQPQLDVMDEIAIEWAKKFDPSLVRVKESLDRVELRKAVVLMPDGTVVHRESGQPMDFARWTEGGDNVSFTPAYQETQ